MTQETVSRAEVPVEAAEVPFAIYNGCTRLRALAEKSPGYSRSDFAQHLALKHRAVCDTVVELLASPIDSFAPLDRPRLLLIADLNIEIAAMALAEVERIDVANGAAIRQRLVERLANAPSAEGGAA